MNRARFFLAVIFVAGTCLATSPAQTKEFNWDNMLQAWMALHEDFAYSTEQVDSYMRVYRAQVYKESVGNEFRMRAERKKTKEMMKNFAKAFDPKTEFVLTTSLTLGKYDFDKESFPVTQMRENNGHYWWPRSGYGTGSLPSSIKVYFANAVRLKAVPMVEAKASNFLGSRKKRYGGFDRSIYAVIRFRIAEIKSVRRVEFHVEITSATIYETNQKSRILFEDRGAKSNTSVSKE